MGTFSSFKYHFERLFFVLKYVKYEEKSGHLQKRVDSIAQ